MLYTYCQAYLPDRKSDFPVIHFLGWTRCSQIWTKEITQKLPPNLKQFRKWGLPIQSLCSSLTFDAFLPEKWSALLLLMVLCLAGVADAVDWLTQHLFPSPSPLPPFTVEAVQAPQRFPTHSPSFPGIWAEDGGSCYPVGGSPWQLWQCFWESGLLPDKWEEWSRHQTSHFFSYQIYTWPWKLQPRSGYKQVLKISEWKYRRNLGSWWLGWVTIALESCVDVLDC